MSPSVIEIVSIKRKNAGTKNQLRNHTKNNRLKRLYQHSKVLGEKYYKIKVHMNSVTDNTKQLIWKIERFINKKIVKENLSFNKTWLREFLLLKYTLFKL